MSRKIIHPLTPTLTLFFYYLFVRTSSSNVETSLQLNTSHILPTTPTTTEFAKSKVEEENARLSAALSSLNLRIVQLEESLRRRGDSAELSTFFPITSAQGVAFSFPCILLTMLTLLLLIITLLILSNILMIRKLSRGHNEEGAAMGQAKQREKGVDMDRKGTSRDSSMKPQEVVQLVKEGV